MSIVPIDLTTADLTPEGNYEGVVTSVKYVVKTGELFNKVGSTVVDKESWIDAAYQDAAGKALKKLVIGINLTGAGMEYIDLYASTKALWRIKELLDACGVGVTEEGFDPDNMVGKPVGVTITHKTDNYGTRAEAARFYRV